RALGRFCLDPIVAGRHAALDQLSERAPAVAVRIATPAPELAVVAGIGSRRAGSGVWPAGVGERVLAARGALLSLGVGIARAEQPAVVGRRTSESGQSAEQCSRKARMDRAAHTTIVTRLAPATSASSFDEA